MKRLLTYLLLLSLTPLWCHATDITSLSDGVGKTFTINTVRGSWYVASGTTVVNACKGLITDWPSGLSAADYAYPTVTDATAFTLVKVTNKDYYYLYCPSERKFVVTNGDQLALSDTPVANDNFNMETATGSTTNNTYPYCLYFGLESAHNMYGISPHSREVDVFKYYSRNDAGNSSALTIASDSYTLPDGVQAKVDALFGTTTYVVSAGPIASTADFSAAGQSYIIRNVSSASDDRAGYLHVDASGNITHQSSLPAHLDDATYKNFIFKTVTTTGTNGKTILVLRALNGEGGYIPKPTFSESTNFGTTTTEISSAGKATVEVKSGYPATTMNFLIDGNYMNVNSGTGVTIWNHEDDANGVWQLIPVSNNDFVTTTTIARKVSCQDGNTGTLNYSVSGNYRSGQHVLIPAVDFLSSGVSDAISGTTINVSVTERLPFEISNLNNNGVWYWYNLDLRNSATPKWVAATSATDGSASVTLNPTFTDDDYSQWAITGSTIAGFKLYNKGLGTAYTMKGSNPIVMTTADSNNQFIIAKNSDGFTLRTGRNGNNYINDVGNYNSFSYWNNSQGATDEGSTFRVFLPKGYYTMLNYQNASGTDTNYGYLGVSTTASTNTNLKGNDASASLTNVVYLAPTSVSSSSSVDPRYVTLQVEGKYIQSVSQSAQVTVGTDAVCFMPVRPNFSYYAFGSVASGATAPTQFTYLHCEANNKNIVGWETAGGATRWQISPAGTYELTANQVGDNYYATFYAPFAVELSGAKAYTMTLNSDKASATLHEVTLVGENKNILPANSPVVIIATSNTYTVKPVVYTADAVTGTLPLTGVSLATSWNTDHENDLVLGKNSAGEIGFYKWSTGNTLKNNRAYISSTDLANAPVSAAKGITIDFGTATGINAATLQPAKTDGKIYNLQGQEVTRSYKGVVIKNGRKVLQ